MGLPPLKQIEKAFSSTDPALVAQTSPMSALPW